MHLMENEEGENQTSVTEFILLGFGDLPELQILLFLLFLVIYIVTMAGNILIVALVVAYQHLHTPMYFSLGNLSCLETCYISTVLPRMLASLLTGDRTISVEGCMIQLVLFGSLVTTECYLLTVMSYDRYLAICKPLHYGTLMNGRLCLQLAAGSWISGFLVCRIFMCLMPQLIFCGPNEIDHFFCDFTSLIQLSCSDTSQITPLIYIFSFLDAVSPFLLTLASYICIIAGNPIHHREAKGLFHLLLSPHYGGTFLWDHNDCLHATEIWYLESPEQSVLHRPHSPDSPGQSTHLQPEKQRGPGSPEKRCEESCDPYKESRL
ncbi:unnamed protein product, partial [Natator depressus]